MNRYDHHFRALKPLMRANAGEKLRGARIAILEHRHNGFGPEDDDAIVHQFDLSGMAEFWDLELSEPMACLAFVHTLAAHFMIIQHKAHSTAEEQQASGPAAMQAVDIVRIGLRSAMRQARIDGEPWFLDAPEPQPSSKLDAKAWLGFVPSDVVIVPPDPPSDGVDLSKLRVRPRAAADWLFAMPKRRHLVPPSLMAVLKPASIEATESTPANAARGRGRTKGTGYAIPDTKIARRMVQMVKDGEATSLTQAAWAAIGRDGVGALGIAKPEGKVARLVKAANQLQEPDPNRG